MTTTTSETTLRCRALVEKVRTHLNGTADRFPVTCSARVQWVERDLVGYWTVQDGHNQWRMERRRTLRHVDPALDDHHGATL